MCESVQQKLGHTNLDTILMTLVCNSNSRYSAAAVSILKYLITTQLGDRTELIIATTCCKSKKDFDLILKVQ
jgi:hypothetical protein